MRRTTRYLAAGALTAALASACTAPPAAPAGEETVVATGGETGATTPGDAGATVRATQSAEDASYEPPPLDEVVAGVPAGWDERTLGEIVLATPPGWEPDPDYGDGMVLVDGWLSHDADWALHGANPAKITVNHSVGTHGGFERMTAQGSPVLVGGDGTEIAIAYRANDDIVLGRHVSGSVVARVPGSPDEYQVSFALPPDDVSVETVAALVGSIRAAG